jgi:hypothetical protein
MKAICNWSWEVIVGEHELSLEFATLENLVVQLKENLK